MSVSKITIEINEELLKKLIINYLSETLGSTGIEEKDITIQVKSKQNYKSEWESAAFRAMIEKNL